MPIVSELDPITGRYKLTEPTGYIRLYDEQPTKANYLKYVYEHRKVMEEHLRRELLKNEIIHHLDGNKSNNALENLRMIQENLAHMEAEHMDPVTRRYIKVQDKIALLKQAKYFELGKQEPADIRLKKYYDTTVSGNKNLPEFEGSSWNGPR